MGRIHCCSDCVGDIAVTPVSMMDMWMLMLPVSTECGVVVHFFYLCRHLGAGERLLAGICSYMSGRKEC